MPRGILAFHRAWLTLDEQYRQVIAVYYGAGGVDREEKAQMLGMSRSGMYKVLDGAHVRLVAVIEDEDASTSSTSSRQFAVNRS